MSQVHLYILMRNQHLEFHNPNMHVSNDLGGVDGRTEGKPNNNAPLYFKCRGGGRGAKNEL